MLEIGLGDGFLGLHRMHEAQACLRQRLGDKPHFAQGRDIIMGNAGVPQDAQKLRRGIGLDCIERPARKLLDEEAGGTLRGVRTQQRDRLDRSLTGDVGNRAIAVMDDLAQRVMMIGIQ